MQNFWNNITIGWADTFSYLQLSGAVYLIWRNWFFPLFSSGFGDFHTILNQLYLGFSFPPPKPKQVMLKSFIYPNIFSYMTSILLPFNRLVRTSSTKIFQCLNLTLIKTPRLHKQLKKKQPKNKTKTNKLGITLIFKGFSPGMFTNSQIPPLSDSALNRRQKLLFPFWLLALALKYLLNNPSGTVWEPIKGLWEIRCAELILSSPLHLLWSKVLLAV